LEHGPHGKPGLHPQHASDLQFNVSHSGDWVLLALSRSVAVGIDVESIRPLPQVLALAERYFSANEIATLRACLEAEREATFLALWTRKEAQVKALGTGLAHSLDQELPGPWTIQTFTVAPGHLAAIAVRASDAEFTFHDLTNVWATAPNS
jgi:4'-phosphopantetheinyl transferase